MLRKVRSSLVASSSGHWIENLGFPTRLSEENYEENSVVEEEEDDTPENVDIPGFEAQRCGSTCSPGNRVHAIPDFDKENPDRYLRKATPRNVFPMSEPNPRTDSDFKPTHLTSHIGPDVITKPVQREADHLRNDHQKCECTTSCNTTDDDVSSSDSGAGRCVIADVKRPFSSLSVNKGFGCAKLVISMPISEEADPTCHSLQTLPPQLQQPSHRRALVQPSWTETSAKLSSMIDNTSEKKDNEELQHFHHLSSAHAHGCSQVEKQNRQLGNEANLSYTGCHHTYTHPTSLQKPRHRRPIVQQATCQPQELLQLLLQQQKLRSGLMMTTEEPKSTVVGRRKEEVGSCTVDGGDDGELESAKIKLDDVVVLRSTKGLRELKKIGVIGGGGSSKIFKVLSKDYQVYALKEVYMKHLDPVIQHSFMEEVQLLKQLRGRPEIIYLHDYSWDKEEHILYILLDCADVDLCVFIKSGHLQKSVNPVVATWQLWNEMLQIVKVIHDEGIIHNDLKPENFVCKGRNISLIDFGISSRITAEHTSIERDVRCGTVNYMAPETIEASGEEDHYKVGKPCDIWSLGCILYQMVYMRTPFEHIKNKMKKWCAIINCSKTIAYPQLSQSYTKLVEIMKKCLTKDPKRRPTVDELISYSSMDNFVM